MRVTCLFGRRPMMDLSRRPHTGFDCGCLTHRHLGCLSPPSPQVRTATPNLWVVLKAFSTDKSQTGAVANPKETTTKPFLTPGASLQRRSDSQGEQGSRVPTDQQRLSWGPVKASLTESALNHWSISIPRVPCSLKNKVQIPIPAWVSLLAH